MAHCHLQYYYNRDTKTSHWKKPPELIHEENKEAVAAAAANINSESGCGSGFDGATVAELWSTSLDATIGLWNADEHYVTGGGGGAEPPPLATRRRAPNARAHAPARAVYHCNEE